MPACSQANRFEASCTRCARLVDFLDGIREEHPDYHAAPVPSFGDPDARLLVVGLAPGMHGANRTGRPFTGDFAGILLYETLHHYGYGSAPESVSVDDGLVLKNCRITNAVRCLPPQNKPEAGEVNNCNDYLLTELGSLPEGAVILALGGIAHKAVIRALGLRQADYKFGHDARHRLPGNRTLVDSYHCSRYNTQTRRLTTPMFHSVFDTIGELLDAR